MRHIVRRQLLIAGSALLAAPFAKAQRAGRIYRIGFVSVSPPGPRSVAFLQGLRELGYVEGQNVNIEMRFAEERPERLPALVEEVIRLKIDVLVVGSTIGARAAKMATSTIPTVFAGSSDPVAGGIVTNLARPGGNITGFSLAYGDGFAGKWLELLREAAPNVSHVAAIWNSNTAAHVNIEKELRMAAQKSKVRLDVHHAANPSELDEALAAIGAGGARGLIVTPSPFFSNNQDKLVRFAESKRLPAMYFLEFFVDAGGLMSYGPSIADSYRRAALYVDKILKGAKPGDLPVEQPPKVRAHRQPEDRARSWAKDPAIGPASCRSGHRMKQLFEDDMVVRESRRLKIEPWRCGEEMTPNPPFERTRRSSLSTWRPSERRAAQLGR